jgi:hypothetical protein
MTFEQFTVEAQILDPDDGEGGIVAQAMIDGAWKVKVLTRHHSVATARTDLKNNMAEWQRKGRAALVEIQ